MLLYVNLAQLDVSNFQTQDIGVPRDIKARSGASFKKCHAGAPLGGSVGESIVLSTNKFNFGHGTYLGCWVRFLVRVCIVGS